MLLAVQPPLALAGVKLTFEARPALVQLYVANVETRWQTESLFRAAMELHGAVERCFIMRNPKGASKVWATEHAGAWVFGMSKSAYLDAHCGHHGFALLLEPP